MRTFTYYAMFASVAFAVPAVIAFGCGSSSDTKTSSSATTTSGSASAGSGTGGGGTAGGTSVGGASATGAGGMTSASAGGGGHPVTECQSHVYECGDGVDNDGDGLVDSDDPDCLGPCDNTEGNYYGGIPGQNNAPCKSDCYFDQDTGPGNDDCYWSHKCDPHEAAPDYYPETESGSQCSYDKNANTPGTNKTCDELYNAQSDACLAYCGPLTPNGCDCFGCCELPSKSGKFVYLGSVDANGNGSCDIASVADPTKCHPCLPVAGCFNDCGHCELCVGKTTLPDDCTMDGGSAGAGGSGGGGSAQCPPNVQPCGLPNEAACPNGFYCITGCCQQIPN